MKKRFPTVRIIVWFVAAAVWTAVLCLDLLVRGSGTLVTVLHGICAVGCFVSAITSLLQYRRDAKKKP